MAPNPAETRRMRDVVREALSGLTPSEVPKGWTLTQPGSGAEFRMQADEFRITVPNRHARGSADAVWSDIWRVLRAVAAEGYMVFDPQLDRILDIDNDMQNVVTRYVGTPPPASQQFAVPQRKPWWRFW